MSKQLPLQIRVVSMEDDNATYNLPVITNPEDIEQARKTYFSVRDLYSEGKMNQQNLIMVARTILEYTGFTPNQLGPTS